jgi:2-C-methyl-D-erythritol 4-phosphate cytidylyltransferase
MIHDGARPLVDKALVGRCYEAAKRYGACVAGVPVKDTIKNVDRNGAVVDTPNRASLWQIQTPQSFQYDKIMEAYARMMEQEDTGITDDSMVMERYGDTICHVVEGDYRNIKITTPEDLVVAQAYLSQR